MAKIIKSDDFESEVLQEKEKIVVVDFYADWCGPCQMMAPVFEELSQEMDNVKFVKINVDENSKLASQYSVFSIPTFLIFKEGEVIGQMVGAMSKERMEEEINQHLNK